MLLEYLIIAQQCSQLIYYENLSLLFEKCFAIFHSYSIFLKVLETYQNLLFEIERNIKCNYKYKLLHKKAVQYVAHIRKRLENSIILLAP